MVDDIVVAVPSAEAPSSAEVLCFERDVMIEACNLALTARKKENSSFVSYKAPIFIALDRGKGHTSDVTVGLKIKAKWSTLIPLADVPIASQTLPGDLFIERVKREFADLNGVDASKVVVEFKIIS